MGERGKRWNDKQSEVGVKSTKLSYFSRSYPVREFERYTLSELQRQGEEGAKEVLAVNDGAAWIRSFIDYHCPKAVQVIDFSRAQSYVSRLGKMILGEETEAFKAWHKAKSYQLKH